MRAYGSRYKRLLFQPIQIPKHEFLFKTTLVYNQQNAFPNFYQDMLNRAPLVACSPTSEMTGFYNAQLAYVEIESCPPKINAVNATRIYNSHVTHVRGV